MHHTLIKLTLLVALTACTNKGDTDPVDTDLEETDVEDTEVDDTDTDIDTSLTSCTLTPNVSAFSTREIVTFTVTGDDGSGTPIDVTSSSVFSSDDTDVLDLFVPPVGQPLDGGSVTVTATVEGVSCDTTLTITLSLAAAGDLVINEFMTDVDGDQNGDGSTDAVDDEFVEIANASDVSIDLGGVTLVETDFAVSPRHTFADGTMLRAGEAIVVFGGGDASTLAEDFASFVIADNNDAGLLWGLNLNGDTETITLKAQDGTTITSLAYDGVTVPAGVGTSVTLNPDVWGIGYVEHSSLGATMSSPGTWAAGTSFEGPEQRYLP